MRVVVSVAAGPGGVRVERVGVGFIYIPYPCVCGLWQTRRLPPPPFRFPSPGGPG